MCIYICIYNIYVYIYICVCVCACVCVCVCVCLSLSLSVFTTDGFFEVAIESWPEWDLNPRPLIPFRRSNQMSYQAISSTRTQSQLFRATPISSFVQCDISFRLLPLLLPFGYFFSPIYVIYMSNLYISSNDSS